MGGPLETLWWQFQPPGSNIYQQTWREIKKLCNMVDRCYIIDNTKYHEEDCVHVGSWAMHIDRNGVFM